MKKTSNYLIVILLLSGLVLLPGYNGLIAQPLAPSQIIFNTKHNLSISGLGTVKSTTERRMCIFCHIPHHASTEIPYLWNRALSAAEYTSYQSTTMYAVAGQPTGASKMCLSCHDGTIALGALVSETQEIEFAGGLRFMPEGPSKLGTDLSDDHPVSFEYDNVLFMNNNELQDPSGLTSEVMLDSEGFLQCTSCHDPHRNDYGSFLVKDNTFSAICTTCHKKDGWDLSLHSTSAAVWNGTGSDPWPHTPYNTVSENGCENCHRPHTAGGHERLLNYAFEEDNCIICHNGNAASSNIEIEITKTYRHPVQDYTGVHDAAEDFTSGSVPDHVECSDCHNPHQANSDTAVAPFVPGALKGVTGIDSSGQRVENSSYEYEICYNCHADNNVISMLPLTREIADLNTRLEFDPVNPSFHPVEIEGVNPDVPSLLFPYTISSIIYCTDCHSNDDTAGPAGSHGSIYEYLLEENYTTDDDTIETATAYALCYKCHDRNSILADQSFSKHSLHLGATVNAPCSACHDAHGISDIQGNSINNTHLINFDINIVNMNSASERYFEDLGTFTGRCFLNCHANEHNPKQYP